MWLVQQKSELFCCSSNGLLWLLEMSCLWLSHCEFNSRIYKKQWLKMTRHIDFSCECSRFGKLNEVSLLIKRVEALGVNWTVSRFIFVQVCYDPVEGKPGATETPLFLSPWLVELEATLKHELKSGGVINCNSLKHYPHSGLPPNKGKASSKSSNLPGQVAQNWDSHYWGSQALFMKHI